MASLSKNGTVLASLVCRKTREEPGDESGSYTTQKIEYRAMSSGVMLKKVSAVAVCDEMPIGRYSGDWKRAGKVKANLMSDRDALRAAMDAWAADLRAKGYETTVTVAE